MTFLKFLLISITIGIFPACSFSSTAAYFSKEPENIRRGPTVSDMSPIQNDLFRLLKNKPSVQFSSVPRRQASKVLDVLLFTVYQENNFFPYWVTEYGPTRKARILLSVLRRSDEEGLRPARYRTAELTRLLMKRKKTYSLAELDLRLSCALYTYLGDMLEGAAPPCLLPPDLFADARFTKANRWVMLREAVNSPDLRLFLTNLSPSHYYYQGLKKLLAKYKKLAGQGGWPRIPSGPMLRPGMTDPRVRLLAKRLLLSGDLQNFSVFPPPPLITRPKPFPGPIRIGTAERISLSDFLLPPAWRRIPPPAPQSSHRQSYQQQYNAPLLKAVRSFQQRYGLKPDGVIGKNTLNALNLTVKDHIRKIILNMERWRWLPHELGGRRILVNVAGFRLFGMNNRKVEISMPVIVGQTSNKTPIFNHLITYIEVNPYWNIPPSIAHNEILAKVLKNPSYLRQHRIRVFADWQAGAPEIMPERINWQNIGSGIRQFHLRQEPGPRNSLGTIKFMFPNNNNVYLHDTTTHSLFKRVRRDFSHGCIRLSRPLDLADYILSNDNYQAASRSRLKAQIASKKRKIFVLNSPLAVHLIYRTVWVDRKSGTAYFYDDIYGRDAPLAKALFSRQDEKCRYSY